MSKPNLLFVFSDQHRLRSLGRYTADIITPNLDAFADSAANFTSCIANSPLCVPMRGSLLTGMYAWNHCAVTNDLPICMDVRSFADVMNENGYYTGYIGKWHLGGVPRDKFIPENERLGFREWKVANCNHEYDQGYYYDENNVRHEYETFESIGQTDLAIDFIKRGGDSEKAWALTLSWGPPHPPFNAVPREYLALYDPDKLELPPNLAADLQSLIPPRNDWLAETGLRKWLQGYYALITMLDDQFKRLLYALKQTGQLDDTIIVYTSDHGDMLGSHRQNKKQLPYNESIKVPLMVKWGERTVNVESNEIIGLTDLPVSLMGLMGLEFGAATDGKDLHDLFICEKAKGLERVPIYDLVPCHLSKDIEGKEWFGFYSRDYVYAVYCDGSDFIIYDNKNDPEQLHNLAKSRPELSKQLSDELNDMLNELDFNYRPWKEFIIGEGFRDVWNKSQLHLNRAPLYSEEERRNTKN